MILKLQADKGDNVAIQKVFFSMIQILYRSHDISLLKIKCIQYPITDYEWTY